MITEDQIKKTTFKNPNKPPYIITMRLEFYGSAEEEDICTESLQFREDPGNNMEEFVKRFVARFLARMNEAYGEIFAAP